MQPFIYIAHLGPTFNEIFDNIDLLAAPCFESLGVVSDNLVIFFKADFFFNVMGAPLFAYQYQEACLGSRCC
jgi:hypothetical protein